MSQETDREEGAPPRKVRLVEIARETGFSRATVSLALRNHPSIPDRTREKILNAARALGYVYNRGAASLRTSTTQTVGILVHDVTNPYFGEIVAAIQDEMTRRGRVVLFGNTRESPTRQSEFIDTFREYNVGGIIMCPAAGTNPADIQKVQASGLPLVVFSRDLPEVEVDYVGGANLKGMQAATSYLVSLGHRRIAMIGVNRAIATGQDRLAGYLLALRQAGIEQDPTIIIEGPATRAFGMDSVLDLLQRDPLLTACVCFNDVIAFGVMLGLMRLNRTPGQDFSVIGFDDISEASLWQPPLTTLGFSRTELGRRAASLLMQRIAEPQRPSERIILPHGLKIRQSTWTVESIHA